MDACVPTSQPRNGPQLPPHYPDWLTTWASSWDVPDLPSRIHLACSPRLPRALIQQEHAPDGYNVGWNDGAADDGEPFQEKMKRLTATLREQRAEAARLDAALSSNLREVGYGS